MILTRQPQRSDEYTFNVYFPVMISTLHLPDPVKEEVRIFILCCMTPQILLLKS